MEFKTEAEMQFAFIEFLEKQGYPCDTIETKQHISSKTAKFRNRLDIAIVVGGKIVQAFELKKNAKTKDIKRTLQQVEMYEEFMDSARVSAEIHIVTHDDGKWWVFSKQKQRWLNASTLSFEQVARDFYIKAKEQVKHVATQIEKPNFKLIKITCWSMAIIALLYIVAYITLYAVKSCGKSAWDLPLSLEVISMFAIMCICFILPILLPFIKSIKFSEIELQLYATDYIQIKRER